MKARSLDQCVKQAYKEAYKEAEESFLKKQYALYKDMAYTFTVLATAADLATHLRRGRSPEYIKKLFDEMCFMYDYPELYGKPLHLTEVMKKLEDECGIDFKKIKVHLETEEQFVKSIKNRSK